MIIDTHTHFYDPSRPQGVPWPAPSERPLYRRVLPEHFRAVAAPCGVTGTVVVEASPWLEDNQWVLDLAAGDPTIVGLVGHVEPGQPVFRAQIDRFAANPLFLGIRVGGTPFESAEEGTFMADLEHLVRRDLELDVIIGKGHLPQVCQVARRLPELRMVLNHIVHVPIDGGPPDAEWVDLVHQAAQSPGMYMKVSAVLEQSRIQPAPADPAFYEPTLQVLWEAFGASRLVFGSNWPVCERASDYATAFRVVDAFFTARGPQARENYYWGNSRQAYRWGER